MLYSSYRLVAHSIGCHTVCRLLEVGLRSFTEVTDITDYQNMLICIMSQSIMVVVCKDMD